MQTIQPVNLGIQHCDCAHFQLVSHAATAVGAINWVVYTLLPLAWQPQELVVLIAHMPCCAASSSPHNADSQTRFVL